MMKRATIIDETTVADPPLERNHRAQNRETERAPTGDLDAHSRRTIVRELLDTDAVIPVPEEPVLVHEASGAAFESIQQLVVFHRWLQATREDGESKGR